MLTKIWETMPEFRQMTAAVENEAFPVYVTGLAQIHKAHLIAALTEKAEKPALILMPDEASATKLSEDLRAFLGGGDGVALYPARDYNLRGAESASREYEHARLRVLGLCASGSLRAVIASAEAVLQYTMPPDILAESTVLIRQGESIDIETLTELLLRSGYQRAEQVDGVCRFSRRGGLLDVFPPDSPYPVRIEFWGDEVDTLSYFDKDTQRRTDAIPELEITPAREVLYGTPEALKSTLEHAAHSLRGKQAETAKAAIRRDIERIDGGLEPESLDRYQPLLYPEPCTLFNYLPDALVFVSEFAKQREDIKNATWQFDEDIKQLFEEGLLFRGCDRFRMDFGEYCAELQVAQSVFVDSFARTLHEISPRAMIAINAMQLAAWGGELSVLEEDLTDYLERGYCCVVLAGTEKSARAIAADLAKQGFPVTRAEDLSTNTPKSVCVLEGAVSAGVEYPEIRFCMLSHSKVQQTRARVRRVRKAGEEIKSLSDLTPGDYVVHVTHGIGVFEGIIKREIHGVVKDYIKIRYAGTDALFVPVTQLDLVSKYIGPRDDGKVKLNRLNSSEWGKARSRVKSAAKEMARELIQLYAARMNAKGFAFSEDTDWQRDFEDRFPYEETDDQLRCIEEIKADMETERPMERLLCGDVGFGKTEVAIRAAFKCVMDSKQCAVLVPTTILAWQHYQTFLARMEGFPINVEMLSRFRTRGQQEQILAKLRRGEIDIVIGTHRIVQKDVQFRDLGLCIIDEEQRFGVAHKEKLKELRSQVDVLTLSATPIPRTLSMAMSGLRDMSVIEEAPQDRHPVQTYVLEHDWGIVAEAMKKELRRGGQVFYLHNRIDSIESCAAKIQNLLPDARIITAHGRMGEETLSEVWRQLLDHEIDILVCTTIIEAGVDVPNCNTLIIEHADAMGLAQLYQLRGRVGRSNRRAFAYFTFTRDKALTDIASKRLSAIRDFTSFGSGFKIAMRDLEIRGAGNILSAKQHGHMEAVGYEMYMRLLGEAIAEEKGEPPAKENTECLIDLQLDAHIPERYIDGLSQRIDIYKKIAGIRTEDDALDVTDELIDRFGEPPQSVKGLIDVAMLRNLAADLGMYEIVQKSSDMFFRADSFDLQSVGELASVMRGRVKFNAGAKPYLAVRMIKDEEPIQLMRTVLTRLVR